MATRSASSLPFLPASLRAALVGTLLFLAQAAMAADRPAKLVLCHENQDSYPWIMTDRPGLNILLLKLLERDLKLPVEFVPLPWKRCLAELAAGRVDGAFAASFKADRLAMGRYPGAARDTPDPAKRLHGSSYSLYRLKGGNLDWDGSAFHNLSGPVGILSGFSIQDFLLERGVQVDEGTGSPERTLRKLEAGRIQGAALQTRRADHLLQHPELAARIERLPVPLEDRPYYLMLSFDLVRGHPALAEDIWNRVARLRDSGEFRQIERDFYNN
ncbi:substrate-binding periplasmic protein [Noviherbaspirillum galbum]|uniref:Transporter substrate-binding domain-containing protein n=1 Tax=Noviherbaspirillum galbum TaxID=2709383 RepID=A0A6B3SIT3_9BURK|nr:transporter substrate-binding domain-containing protein [Noviherbaspirillum galbum]NEX60741.1 hypothetical protein [Noviherbaspirillum galbum]